jgi:hypothetical protein
MYDFTNVIARVITVITSKVNCLFMTLSIEKLNYKSKAALRFHLVHLVSLQDLF